METSAYSVLGIGIDVSLVFIVGLAVLLVNLLAHPFERGFYCNDESIYYPYQGNTVSTLVVTLVSLFLPVLVIGVSEWVANKRDSSRQVFIGKKSFPRMIVRTLRLWGVFLFGAGTSQLVVDVAKYWIGRLRPHFIAACLPDLATLCGPLAPPYKYITEYTCQGGDAGAIEEARLSFPSGHSALSFYAAVFTVIYLQCSGDWRWSRLARHLLQALLMLAAWWTALTRVSDYFHHWSDVLAGIISGSLIAVLNIVYVSDLPCFGSKACEQEHLPLMTSCNSNSPASYSSSPDKGDQNNV